MNNKISIIIPAYNVAEYLPVTLNSILAQTYPNLEIIVVDDGSSDSTSALVDAYAVRESRILAIHKENGGVTSARLRGVEAATGEWIGFVDGDDYVEPHMYEVLLANALKYHVDISHCGYQMVFPSGRLDYYYNTGRIIKQNHTEGLRDLLEGSFVEPALWNKLFRRELFEDLSKKMDRSIRINEDLLMNYYLFQASQCAVYEDICPYHYMLRKGSAATAALNEHHLLDPIRVTETILTDADPSLRNTVLARLARQLIALATMDTVKQPNLILSHRRIARRKLRRLLCELLTAQIPAKIKIMALWAAMWPASYGWVHSIYARLTGVDKKYTI